jgi:GTP-binding protein Era
MDGASQTPFHSGFVALVGRPSVGKSTLLNACIGEKVAITSPVAQTTRRRLRAVVNTEHAQLVIVDTPGLHKPKDALGKELNKAALGELADVDVAAFLIDATKPVGRGDEWVAKHVEACSAPFKLLVITKADIATPEQVMAQRACSRSKTSGRISVRRSLSQASTRRRASASRSSGASVGCRWTRRASPARSTP